jgi:hypothetical protein
MTEEEIKQLQEAARKTQNMIIASILSGKEITHWEENKIEFWAEELHQIWSNWQKYLYSKCIKNDNGSLNIPKEFVDRWNRQINTEYKDLPEEEKQSDRELAKKVVDLIDMLY